MKIKSLIVFGVLGLLIIISGQALADGGVRLVSVVGRGGMGKTALVSRVLADLERLGAAPITSWDRSSGPSNSTNRPWPLPARSVTGGGKAINCWSLAGRC